MVLLICDSHYLGQLGLQEVTELQDLLTPGRLTITDDRRMARIRVLDAEVREQHVFVLSFLAGRMDGRGSSKKFCR